MTAADALSHAFGSTSLAASDLNPYSADVLADMTNAQKVFFVNQALDRIALRSKKFDPSVVWTLTASVDTYSLRGAAFSKRIVVPKVAVINGNPLLDAKREFYGFWSFGELQMLHPGYRALDADVPCRCAVIPGSAILSPKPTQAVVDAGSNYMAGEVLPTLLTVNGSDVLQAATTELDLESELHFIACELAVVLASTATADETNAWTRLQAFRSDALEQIDAVAERNQNLLSSWRTLESYDDGEMWV